MAAVGEEIHLTVGLVEYEILGQRRHGVATHFLCNWAPGDVVPIYLHPSEAFSLPTSPHAPIIMVGPGTGIAPFRGFLQERQALCHEGLNWLFFGERNRATDFLYEEDFAHLTKQGNLRLDLAFSRDQQEKVYVQHRMEEQSIQLWRLLEEGAYFYVCGDAFEMARAVDGTLHKIVEKEGKMAPEEAKAYVRRLKTDGRYLRDVY